MEAVELVPQEGSKESGGEVWLANECCAYSRSCFSLLDMPFR